MQFCKLQKLLSILSRSQEVRKVYRKDKVECHQRIRKSWIGKASKLNSLRKTNGKRKATLCCFCTEQLPKAKIVKYTSQTQQQGLLNLIISSSKKDKLTSNQSISQLHRQNITISLNIQFRIYMQGLHFIMVDYIHRIP